ncbi:ABC transporter transmembrane domain-containing protein [Prochlorococcus sp. AH-716-M06]|nr:ABC transporter transmembrane domain-containing protein [Prochlorococcus sp. AH-716-M06]
MAYKSITNKKFLEEWDNIFDDLPNKKLNELRSLLVNKNFKQAEEISSYGNIFPGLIKIKNGKVRCIYESKNDLLMLKNYTEGEIFGAEHILSDIQEQTLVSSTSVNLEILPTDLFLKLIEEFPQLYKKFNYTSVPEIFSCIRNSEIYNNFSDTNLLKLSKTYFEENPEIEINPIFNNPEVNYFACSKNFEFLKKGDSINKNSKLETSSKLKPRILKIPNLKNPVSLSEKQKIEKDSRARELKENIKKETYQEWYGKLNNEKFPHFRTKEKRNQLFVCLKMLSIFHNVPFQRFAAKRLLSNFLKGDNISNLNNTNLLTILDLIGLTGTNFNPQNIEQFKRTPLPALLIFKNESQVLWKYQNNNFLISNPSQDQQWVNINKLFENFEDEKIQLIGIEHLSSNKSFKFGFSWFLPSIKKYKYSLLQVIVSSFFVQLLALFNPLLIQQIIDTVISQGNLNALNLLGILLIIMSFSQGLLGTLRTYLFSDITNRIDISLGSKIIKHLYRLPLGYFSKRRVGEVSSRISELEKIRNFMTGTALTITLDAVFSIIYILVMLLYSVKLTLLSMSVIPFFVFLTVFVSPIIKRQLRQKAEYNAKVQSHLVESINGIETIKGQSLEMQSEMRWENFYSNQIKAGFNNTITSVAAGSANQFLQQLSGLIVIWVGAGLVLKGELTLGGLIAFRILSSYVTNPILRLTSLWQNFQETSLALERLSDIVDSKNEKEIKNDNLPFLPNIDGQISFKDVSFKFDSNQPLLLKNINLNINPGEFIGIVGKSGSGKSTLMKLLMGFFNPNEGEILIDNNDITKVDTNSLRTQIGYVPQETFIFDGSIAQNISLTKPDSSLEEIKEAAQLACADEFINCMPNSYASYVGEKGSNLSGGQRQRLGLARVLLSKPRILILDESTSALDTLLEKKIINNLLNISGKLNIIFITHRVYSLKKAKNIFVIDEGKVIEQGNDSELLMKEGRYKMLHDLNSF